MKCDAALSGVGWNGRTGLLSPSVRHRRTHLWATAGGRHARSPISAATCATGRRPTERSTRPPAKDGQPRHYSYLDTAVDDHSRLAYSEILSDEKKETATGFWTRAHAFFTEAGITVERVLTDNGSCYRSRDWRDLLTAAGIAHKRTRPYRPQTNGKVERFNRTLLDEWAYARPYRSETVGHEDLPCGAVLDSSTTPEVFAFDQDPRVNNARDQYN